MPARQARRTGTSATPGASSLSWASRLRVGPATASAPTASPAAAAGTATRAAAAAWASTSAPGVKPSARRTPKEGSRRWTSACALAASIVPAAASATSEKATSSEMTMPAACPRRTRTPSRVMNSRWPMPNDVARACVSVMSARPASASHNSARFGSRKPGGTVAASR